MAPFQPDDYRLLADSIPQIIYSALPDGRVEYYNRAWYAYTGQTPDEALEDGWSSVVHPDDLVRTGERWQEAMRTGEPHHVEFRLRHTDGHYRWFVGRGEPVRDAEGAVVRWYGGCMDIHDLKVAESTIRDHASRFRRLANALPQIVWTSDANGKNTFLNHRWFDYTGVDPRRPHSLAAVTHPDDYPAAWAAWQRSLATGAGYEIEYRLRRVDGVYRWFLGRAVATRAPDDSILEWFGSCTDIEDQKRAEENVRRAFEREHAIATTLQRAFLTHRMPAIDGFRFDAVYRPAEREAEVGGDWYDVIELDDGRIVVSIGDVAGHGLGSAVIMGNVRQAIRAVANVAGPDPAAMLDVADRCLRRAKWPSQRRVIHRRWSSPRTKSSNSSIAGFRSGCVARARSGRPRCSCRTTGPSCSIPTGSSSRRAISRKASGACAKRSWPPTSRASETPPPSSRTAS
jgi:PAS domain S-box-containing protein